MLWAFNQLSQTIGVLTFLGVLAGIYRYPSSRNKLILAGVVIFLFGTFIREAAVYVFGPNNWGNEALAFSSFGRLFQLVGALMFIRGMTKDLCNWWHMALLAGTLLLVAAI